MNLSLHSLTINLLFLITNCLNWSFENVNCINVGLNSEYIRCLEISVKK